MIDLTAAFKDAMSRKQEWGYEQARALARQLADIDSRTEASGGPNGNWIWVDSDSRTAALVYQLAPLVIAQDDLVEQAKEALQDVTVVTGLQEYGDVTFRMDKREAEGMLPHPIEEVDLDWDGFSAWDFVFETV